MKTHFRLLLLSFFVQSLLADVTPNPLFSDNGVLQRGIKIPVWVSGVSRVIGVVCSGMLFLGHWINPPRR